MYDGLASESSMGTFYFVHCLKQFVLAVPDVNSQHLFILSTDAFRDQKATEATCGISSIYLYEKNCSNCRLV